MTESNRRTYKLEEILGKPLITSSDKKTRIYGLDVKGREVMISAYSESESRKGYFHKVEVEYLPASMYLINGSCTCESFQYYGMPCKHMLKVRNVYLKNQNKINKD
ncbi:SWIM zinc finger domain-containing protein [Candidatus Parvarchaeota archaeon]|nr:SWIM zinc finger domain-containing protein [Candidatus Parvarchaeota archaeon]